MRWLIRRKKVVRLTAMLLSLFLGLGGCSPKDQPNATSVSSDTRSQTEKPAEISEASRELTSESIARIEQFCGDCHGMPRPDFFPKHAWRKEVDRGYQFYFASDRTDLELPVVADTVAYFEQRAPLSIGALESGSEINAEATPLRQPAHGSAEPSLGQALPAVAGLGAEPIGESGQVVPLLCDMRSGQVALLDLSGDKTTLLPLAQLAHPCRATSCDLDADGYVDLIVSELGSFEPEDHDQGKVIWLRGTEQVGVMQPQVLMEGVGRVADARPADFDRDGDLDLVVAEFGYLKTGGIWLLRRDGVDDQGRPRFDRVLLDSRHGTIHVPVVDFDRDGDLDFLALVSQEFESIEWFENRGEGTFDRRTLYTAPDPSFGSSGIEVVDLDGDGDDDIVYANGDTFDSYFLKPYHGVRWLERVAGSAEEPQKGSLAFHWVVHELAAMPGVQHVAVGDLEGDGDVDLVAAAFLPWNLQTEHRDTRLVSLMQLRNQGGGQFEMTALEIGSCNHAATLFFDADHDGDQDLLVGGFFAEEGPSQRSVEIWRNETFTQSPTRSGNHVSTTR